MTKFLIVRTSALGDIAQGFPLLPYLKEKFPGAQIDWVVEKEGAPLLKAHPLVDNTLVIDSKSWRKNPFSPELRQFFRTLRSTKYDAVFDLQANCKSGLITLSAKATTKVGFSRKWVAEWPSLLATNLKVSPEPTLPILDIYLALAKAYCHDKAPYIPRPILLKGKDPEFSIESGTALVCPGSKWPNKELNPRELGLFCSEIPYQILISYGSVHEEELAHELLQYCPRAKILPKRDLPALQRLMAEVDLVIAMDSLPLHLAATAGTKTFSAFGSSSGARYSPGPFIQGSCPYGITFEKRCPQMRTCATGACIKNISATDLTKRFIELKDGTV